MGKNILVRSIPNHIIGYLDDEAKKKKISRSELIREILENHFENINLKIAEEKYLKIINENSKLIKLNIELINNIFGG